MFIVMWWYVLYIFIDISNFFFFWDRYLSQSGYPWTPGSHVSISQLLVQQECVPVLFFCSWTIPSKLILNVLSCNPSVWILMGWMNCCCWLLLMVTFIFVFQFVSFHWYRNIWGMLPPVVTFWEIFLLLSGMEHDSSGSLLV